MLNCVITQNFIDDLKGDNSVTIFYLSFGRSTVPLSNFSTRDYFNDTEKSTPILIPTILDDGFTVSCQFVEKEISKYNKIYLIYELSGDEDKLAFIFDANDFSNLNQIIKVSLKDLEIKAPITTDHRLDNILYAHRHREFNIGGSPQLFTPQLPLQDYIRNMSTLSSTNVEYTTLNSRGLVPSESGEITPSFLRDQLDRPAVKRLGDIKVFNDYIIEVDQTVQSDLSFETLSLITLNGDLNTLSLGVVSPETKLGTSQDIIGTIKSFVGDIPSNYVAIPYGGELLKDDYPDLFKAIGTKFGSNPNSLMFNVPDLNSRYYIRSAGYMVPSGAGFTTLSKNPATLKNHEHRSLTYTNQDNINGAIGGEVADRDNIIIDGSTLTTSDGYSDLLAKSYCVIWAIKFI